MANVLIIARRLAKKFSSRWSSGQRRSRTVVRTGTGSGTCTELFETRILPAAFPLAPRWATTATNGGGLVQGQPTTLTWSLPADGTLTDDNPFNANPNAPNSLIQFLDTNWGSGPGGSDYTQRPWFTLFNESLERLESLSGLTYVYSPQDDGVPIRAFSNHGVLGTRGDVRVSGASIDGDVGSNIGAQNNFPQHGGDMLIDTDNVSFRTFSENNYRFFRNVLMHEFAHGVGLDHVLSTDSDFLMEASPAAFDIDGLQLADILGLQRHYGDALEKSGGDVFSTAFDFGSISGGNTARIGTLGNSKVVTGTDTDFVSIDDESDVDFYKFTVGAAGAVSLTLTPRGTTFLQGSFDTNFESNFMSHAQSDLALTLFGSDGTTVLQTRNATGTGSTESIQNFQLTEPGTYYARVNASTADRLQLYGLEINVAPVTGGQVFGTVYDDTNGNGAQDQGEQGRSGVTVYLDQNSNGQLDSGETSAQTNSMGRYGFTGLAAGSYQVREVADPNRQPTSPQNGLYSFDLGQDEVRTLLDFGSRILGGTSGNDQFVVTYSSSTFNLTMATNGNPAVSLGTFPKSVPFTLRGNGGNDSVRIFGTTGMDDFQVSAAGLTINGSRLILDGVNTRSLEGGANHDRYAFDADTQLGAYRLVESLNSGLDFLDFTTTAAAVSMNLGLTTSQTVNTNLSLTLSAGNTFEDIAGGAASDTLVGNALNNMIVGNTGNDRITGGAGNDNLQGGGWGDYYVFDADTNLGTDTLTELPDAGGFDILMFAGTVADVTVNLGQALQQTVNSNLKLILSAGNTFEDIEGGAGNDTLIGNSFGNYMYGQEGNDTLIGLGGSDLMSGGSSNDRFVFDTDSALGTDRIEDLSGLDTLDFSSTSSAVSVNTSNIWTQVVNSNLSLILPEANRIENIIGGSGADTLTGNTLANTLTGGPGNDKLNGTTGSDVLIGGLNNDTYLFGGSVPGEADEVRENANEGIDTLSFASQSTGVTLSLGTTAVQAAHTNRTVQLNAINTFEHLIGGSAADSLTGNSLANTLTGGAGDDKLNGTTGNDLLLGGLNNDTYSFGGSVPGEADQVTENPNEGTDTLNFSAQTKRVVMSLATTAVQPVHTNRTVKLNAINTFEHLIGGSAADSLTGNSLANTLTGGAGDDILNGTTGSDMLIGGLNNDTYQFGASAPGEIDQVIENPNQGTDTLNFASQITSVNLNLGTIAFQQVHTNRVVQLNAVNTFENAVGGSGHDTLIGNALANRLTGGNGNNILVGLEAGDTLVAGNGRDILIGGLGPDNLNGGLGDDILIAGRTTSDTSLSNLNTLRTQWISGNTHSARVANLRAGVGSPLVSLKAKTNVLNDAGEDDSLTGGGNLDWYFRAVDDAITDLFTGELVDML